METTAERNGLPSLHWRNPQGEEARVRVDDRVFIGRICAGAPIDKRIVIDDPNVSRDHASITFHEGQLFIRDTSRNGTKLNGARISPGVEQRLHEGDVIQIGRWQFTVQDLDSTRVTQPADEALGQTQVVPVDTVVTHLVADVRGFSTLAQRSEAHTVYALMARLYEELSHVVVAHQGTVKDYAGDAIFAFWEHGREVRNDLALAGCRAALAQAEAAARVGAELAAQYAELAAVQLGWGVSTGRVTLSHYGVRQDNLALVGDSTNLAFRLAGLAHKSVPSPIVVCACTAELVEAQLMLTPLGEVETKGRAGLERIFGLSP